MFRIYETDRGWVCSVGGVDIGDGHPTYQAALAALTALGQQMALAVGDVSPGAPDGLLGDVWEGDIAFSEATGDGRDFTGCTWTARDPAVSTLPLMLQTETEMGHFGAELAGFIETIDTGSGTPHATGRFYDTELGRQARDLLLGDRSFGVSVDPGAVEVEEQCLETAEDEWGEYCVEWLLLFIAYEILGLTMTPFPAFAAASIHLAAVADTEPEPAGEPAATASHDHQAAHACSCGGGGTASTSGGGGSSNVSAGSSSGTCGCGGGGGTARIVRSTDTLATARRPLVAGGSTITLPDAPARTAFDRPAADLARWRSDPDLEPGSVRVVPDGGRVYGYLAAWGECHVGSPMGECIVTPRGLSYGDFHSGYTPLDDGGELAVGRLTLGTGHADLSLSFRGAQEHYDHTGAAVADVRVGEDDYGVWVAGALRPGTTGEQVRTLMASSLSGDWRPRRGSLELCAALAVNSPGFVLPRARVAAGGRVEALVAAGHVRPRVPRGTSLDRDLARLVTERREMARARMAGLRRESAVERLRA